MKYKEREGCVYNQYTQSGACMLKTYSDKEHFSYVRCMHVEWPWPFHIDLMVKKSNAMYFSKKYVWSVINFWAIRFNRVRTVSAASNLRPF
jgi:hypothetical protein